MLENSLFEALLDLIPFKAYAVDLKTYEVVYANQLMRKNMHSPRALHCWEKIFGRNDVCPWCSINALKQRVGTKVKDEKYISDFFDEIDDKWFRAYDELISWANGHEVKYSILIDITDQKEIQGGLIKSHAKLAMQAKHLKTTNKNLQITKLLLNKKSDELKTMNSNLKKIVNQQIIKLSEQDQLLFLQQKQTALNNTMSVIAHQWKQPLQELSINNIFLKEKNKEAKNIKIYDDNDEIIQFLSSTITAFQNFYKVSPVNSFLLHEAIANTTLVLNSSFRQHQIALHCSYDDESIEIKGQRNIFSQVILTILENAISIFFERNISKPQIKISTVSKNDEVIICIEDNGGGIDEVNLPYIFENSKSFRKNKSSGLGLYIANLVITEKFQGTIDAKNNGNGATFTIIIPI